MAFCPICKGNHETGSRCFDRTGQILRDIGIDQSRAFRKGGKLNKRAVFWLWILGLIAVGVVAITIITVISDLVPQ